MGCDDPRGESAVALTIEQQRAVAVASARMRLDDPNAKYKAMSKPEAVDPTEGMSGGEKFLAGAGKAFMDVGRGAGQMIGIKSQAEIDEAKQLDAPLMRTGAGVGGNVVGNIAAFAPTALIPGANTLTGAGLIGAGMGASQPVASGESRAANMAIGGASGVAGQGIANAIGRAIRPVQSKIPEALAPLASKADDYGIPLSAAQKTGSRPLAITESVLENLPFTADKQLAIKQAQKSAFNRAILKTVGENADTASPEVLNAARTRIGSRFDAVASRNTVGLDDEFLNSLSKVESSITSFSSPKIAETIDKGMELAAKGKISGTEYQKIRSSLTKAADSAFKSDAELGQALKSIRDSLDDAAGRSISDADKAAWTEARKQWRALKVVEKASAPTSADAVAGNVSPAKLASVLNASDRGYKYGTGQQELGDLARIGQAFVKEQIPNSGTAQRQFYQGVIENPLRLISGAAGIGSVPVQAMLNSPAGQAYLLRGLLGGRQVPLAGYAERALATGVPAGLLANRE